MPNHKKWPTPADAQRAAVLAWRARNPQKYKDSGSRPKAPKPNIYCDVCEKSVTHGYFPRHIVAACHLTKKEAKQAEDILET
jgi:hypothetical protein